MPDPQLPQVPLRDGGERGEVARSGRGRLPTVTPARTVPRRVRRRGDPQHAAYYGVRTVVGRH